MTFTAVKKSYIQKQKKVKQHNSIKHFLLFLFIEKLII